MIDASFRTAGAFCDLAHSPHGSAVAYCGRSPRQGWPAIEREKRVKTIASKRCRHCAAEMEAASVVCPQCGRDVERSASVRSAVTIGLAVASAILGGFVGTLLHL